MADPFIKIRGAIKAKGLTHPDVARKLLIGKTTFSERINAKSPWTQDEQYEIMNYLDIPYEKMHEYFPRNGQNEPGCSRLGSIKGGRAAM